MLANIEFLWSSDNESLLVEYKATKMSIPFVEIPKSELFWLDSKIKEMYPETHQKLVAKFGEGKVNAYPRCYQFVACNLSFQNEISDIDDDGNFNIAIVKCPIRHRCKDGFCKPVIEGCVSKREKEVLRLFVAGMDNKEIASRLFVSEHTVKNHLRNTKQKLDLYGKPSPEAMLMKWAIKHL